MICTRSHAEPDAIQILTTSRDPIWIATPAVCVHGSKVEVEPSGDSAGVTSDVLASASGASDRLVGDESDRPGADEPARCNLIAVVDEDDGAAETLNPARVLSHRRRQSLGRVPRVD